MKVNKWTLALAATGLVTLPALVQGEEKATAIMTALSSTTISGYVDTSAQCDIRTGNANPPGFICNYGKQDGFNPAKSESYKTYMAAVAITAPESMSFLKGSTLYAGFVNGFNSSAGAPYAGVGADQTSWYLGATIATPVTGLKFGASFDERAISD